MAEAGKLIFVAAGPEAALKAISPFLQDVMGRSVINMGEDVSQSSLLKIAGNICVVSFMEVVAEAHVFAEKTGLGTRVLEQMLCDNFGLVIGSYSKRLTTGAYAPNDKAGFDVALAIKDARHALACAEDVGARLETSEVALRNMEKARELQSGKPCRYISTLFPCLAFRSIRFTLLCAIDENKCFKSFSLREWDSVSQNIL